MDFQNTLLKIGHVHLKVRNLERSISFYTGILGLTVTERVGNYVFLSYGNEHHDIALNEVGEQARMPDQRDVGLYHFAIEVTSPEQMKTLYQRLRAANIETELVDHVISKSFYLDDPDGNGIEIYIDTRKKTGCFEWHGVNKVFDISNL